MRNEPGIAELGTSCSAPAGRLCGKASRASSPQEPAADSIIHSPTFEGHNLPDWRTYDRGRGLFPKDGAGVGRGGDDQLLPGKWGERRIISRSIRYVAWLTWWAQALDSTTSRTVSMMPSLPAKGECSMLDEGLDPCY
jgi:hypothetical protein